MQSLTQRYRPHYCVRSHLALLVAEAEQACRKMTRAFPQAAEAMHLAGLVAMRQGNQAVAAERMGRAAIADANSAEIQHDHAQAGGANAAYQHD